jgi:ABC-type polysaccharide/polyol phosphate export permease
VRRPAPNGYLFAQLVRRELRQKYQGSVLGIAWYLINPLVLMAAYWFLFGVVLKAFSIEDYPLFLLCGLIVWIFFSQSLMAAATSLLDQGALIRKARFAREAIPASVVTVQLVTFLVVLGLLAVLCVAIRGTLEPALLLLPVVLGCLAVFVLGLSLAVAVLHAYYRDVAPILSAALLPWFFLSPIFFNVDGIASEGAERFALEWVNPVAPYIIGVRDVLYGGTVPDLAVLVFCVVAAVAALAGGLALFRRMEDELAVVV